MKRDISNIRLTKEAIACHMTRGATGFKNSVEGRPKQRQMSPETTSRFEL